MVKVQNLFESIKNLMGGYNSPLRAEASALDIFEGASIQTIINFIRGVRELSSKRADLYKDIDTMMNDSVVGAAVELVAEDATQMDLDRMRVCWAEPVPDIDVAGSDNLQEDEKVKKAPQTARAEEVADIVNNFLYNILDIDEIIWALAYNIVGYGEVFLRTYHSEIEEEEQKPKGQRKENLINKKGKLFEIVQNPLKVQDILEYGDTVGYIYTDRDNRQTLYPVKDFIHICNDRGVKREEVILKYTPKNQQKEIERSFTIRYGTSFIATAREAFDTLQLEELIMLLARFNKSAFYRLFKIEVGGATRIEISNILREFKKQLSQSESIDLPSSKYNSKDNPIPYGGNVYIPVKNGKGDVVVESVGGDMDMKALLDIDYYRNKLFAALKIPKAYLGEDESVSGGIGNQSLVRMDVRYSRMVKRCVACLVRGIKQICDYYLITINRQNDLNKYVIMTPHLITAEDTDRSEILMTNLNVAQGIQQILEADENIDKSALTKYLICDVLSMTHLWEALEKGGNGAES